MRAPSRSRDELPGVLAGWPAWAAPAALAGAWALGLLAALLVAIGFGGADAAVAKLALALLSGAGTVALLAWLAARPASEDSARAVVARLGIRRCDPRRALVATAVAASALALFCLLLALAGAFDGVRAPRELTRLDGLAWAAGLSEPAVPFDGAAVASLLARAVIGAVVLELLLRGAVLPALARLIGAWPAIAVDGPDRRDLLRRAGGRRHAAPARARARPAARPAARRHGLDRPRRGALRRLHRGGARAGLRLGRGWGGGDSDHVRRARGRAAAGRSRAAAAPRRRAHAGAARRLACRGGRPERRGVHGRAAARRGDRRRDRDVRRRRPDRGPRGAADLPHRGRRLLRAGRARQGLPARLQRPARAASRSRSRSSRSAPRTR